MKKSPLRHFFPLLLLALSLGGNLWQFLNQSTQDNVPEQKHRPVIAANDFHDLKQKAKIEASFEPVAKKSAELEQPAKRDSYFTASAPGSPSRRSLSEHPEDWMPQSPGERIKAAVLRDMLNEDPPSDNKMGISVKITDKSGLVKDFGTIQTVVGANNSFETSREFPYPTEFDPPQVAPPEDQTARFPVTPTVPVSYEFKETGWRVDLATAYRGRFILLEGLTRYSGFSGFENATGLPFRPLEDENGILSHDNRVTLPKFTTYEMPFIDAVQFGETLQMPIHSPDGEAVLEIAVRRLP